MGSFLLFIMIQMVSLLKVDLHLLQLQYIIDSWDVFAPFSPDKITFVALIHVNNKNEFTRHRVSRFR